MKLARPQLNLTRPKLKRPQLNVEAPQVVTDVVRDLRDRRLLIPAIALAVALVAVPLLLSRSQESPAPPAAPPADLALGGAATEPAVLTKEVSVRDYKERLDQLKSKNPFRQHFSGIDVGKGAGLEGLSGTPVTDATVGGSTPSTLSTGDTGASVSPTPGSTAPTTSPGSSTSGDTGGSPKPDTVTRYVTHRVDISVGETGALEPRNNVPQLKLLPSNAAPVLVFLGTSDDGKRAIFLVSSDVGATSGDGKCLPSPASCAYVALREGDEQTIDYTPDATTYGLKVRDIRTVKSKSAPGVSVP